MIDGDDPTGIGVGAIGDPAGVNAQLAVPGVEMAGVEPKVARARPRRAASGKAKVATTDRPVVRVAVDVPLMHLDRPFDYLVPESMAADAQPGVRVRVRFAGQKVDGFILDRMDVSAHEGNLAFLDSVVSPEPVLTAEVFALARKVADHYVGTIADVLRLAIPPRHARVETAAPAAVPTGDRSARTDSAEPSPWVLTDRGDGFLAALSRGDSPRAVATVPPASSWTRMVADAARSTIESDRGVLVIVPDHRDATRVIADLEAALPAEVVVHLAADAGPAQRYRRFLDLTRGRSRVVVGSRAAAFAPVNNLGLVVIWDDGDDLHAEPRAPYPHVREVAALRAQQGCGLLVLGAVRTAEGERLVRSGWAVGIGADRALVRERAPDVRAAADDIATGRDPEARSAHLPSLALRTLRAGLERGPVLVQVPRAGYVPALRCQNCRERATCTQCEGPLRLTGSDDAPSCGWCGHEHRPWTCRECGDHRVRAARMGARRTAEELGRAFPGTRVVTSGRDGVVNEVPDKAALVIATPGAEPVARGGYAAIALLDGDRLLDRPDLRASEEALRRWSNAVALCRSKAEGGAVVIAAEPTVAAVQALVRSDPEGFAAAEYDERNRAHLPPAARVISLSGAADAVAEFAAAIELPVGAELLGPIPIAAPRRATTVPDSVSVPDDTPHVRLVVRVPITMGAVLADAIRSVAIDRSARKLTHVTTRVDPLVLD